MPPPSCESVPLSRVGSSLAGVMGNESVPEDLEVERDTRAEADGVVIREEKIPSCLRKGRGFSISPGSKIFGSSDPES